MPSLINCKFIIDGREFSGAQEFIDYHSSKQKAIQDAITKRGTEGGTSEYPGAIPGEQVKIEAQKQGADSGNRVLGGEGKVSIAESTKTVTDKMRAFAEFVRKPIVEGALSDPTMAPRWVLSKAIDATGAAIDMGAKLADIVHSVAEKGYSNISDAIKDTIDQIRSYSAENKITIDDKALSREMHEHFGEEIPREYAIPSKTEEQKRVELEAGIPTKDQQQAREDLNSHIKAIAKSAVESFESGKKEGFIEGAGKGIEAGHKIGMAEGQAIGKKEILAKQKQFSEHVQQTIKDKILDLEKSKQIPSVKANQIIKRLSRVQSEKSLSSFIRYTEGVIEDAKYAENIDNIESAQSDLKKPEFGPKDAYNAIKSIDPTNLNPSELSQFKDIVGRYNEQFGKVEKGTYSPFKLSDEMSRLEAIQAADFAMKEKELNERLAADDAKFAEDYIAGNITDESLKTAEMQAKKEALDKRVTTIAQYTQIALQDAMTHKVWPEQTTDYLNKLSKIDISKYPIQLKAEFVRTIENAVANESSANIGNLYTRIEAEPDIQSGVKIAKSNNNLFKLNSLQTTFETFPMMLKSIFGSSKDAAQIRRLSGYNEVFERGAKAKGEFHKVSDEYVKLNLGQDAISRIRRGIFANAINTEGKTPEEIAQSFENNKKLIEQSIELYSTHSDYRQVYETANEFYNLYLDGVKDVDAFIDRIKNDYPEVAKSQEFFETKFDKYKNRVQEDASLFHNREVEMDTNHYTPRGYITIFGSPELTAETGLQFTSGGTTAPKPKPNGMTYDRVVIDKLPEGKALNFDFDGLMLNKMEKMFGDLMTTKGKQKFALVIADKRSADMWGGVKNRDTVLSQYKHALGINQGFGETNNFANDVVLSVTNSLANLGSAVALSGIAAYPKQFIPGMFSTVINLGKDAGLMYDAMFGGVKTSEIPLLKEYSIGFRGEQNPLHMIGEEGRSVIKQINDNFIQDVAHGIEKISLKGKHLSMHLLERGDVNLAQKSWVAYYMKYLKDNGVKISIEDMKTEHTKIGDDTLRQDAASFAQQKVDETQLTSSRATGSKWQKAGAKASTDVSQLLAHLTKRMVFPFSSFAGNSRARIIENSKFIMFGNDTQKSEAIRDMGAASAEIVSFAALSKLAIGGAGYYGLKYLLKKATGSESEDDKTFAETMSTKFRDFYTQVAKDAVTGGMGNIAEDFTMQQGLQRAWWFADQSVKGENQSLEDWSKDNGFKIYANQGSDVFGQYGVGIKEFTNAWSDSHIALTGEDTVEKSFDLSETTTKGGGKQYLTVHKEVKARFDEKDRAYFGILGFLDVLTIAGYTDKDLKAILRSNANDLKKQATNEKNTEYMQNISQDELEEIEKQRIGEKEMRREEKRKKIEEKRNQ